MKVNGVQFIKESFNMKAPKSKGQKYFKTQKTDLKEHKRPELRSMPTRKTVAFCKHRQK